MLGGAAGQLELELGWRLGDPVLCWNQAIHYLTEVLSIQACRLCLAHFRATCRGLRNGKCSLAEQL